VNVKWNYELRADQRANPVVCAKTVTLPDDFICPTDDQLAEIFTGKGHQLITWGRTPGKKVDDPHWIGVKGSTPLHTDPAYPRYTHQLKIRVDQGISARGLDRQPIRLYRGLYYVLDTHSPHQVFRESRTSGIWNVSISIDHDIVLEPAHAIMRLYGFGQRMPFNQRFQ
jgi:hypothetical protein